MTIIYPVNERVMLTKARDSRIMRFSASLAAHGHKVGWEERAKKLERFLFQLSGKSDPPSSDDARLLIAD